MTLLSTLSKDCDLARFVAGAQVGQLLGFVQECEIGMVVLTNTAKSVEAIGDKNP
jgi:hypothetical protein